LALTRYGNGNAQDVAHGVPRLQLPIVGLPTVQQGFTAANLATLRSRGHVVVDPCEGTLACGYEGQGKLAPVDEIVARVVSVLVA